ncbi:MAG: hypothetical protein ACLFPD_05130, partial [Desulfosudaceae bacterium]
GLRQVRPLSLARRQQGAGPAPDRISDFLPASAFFFFPGLFSATGRSHRAIFCVEQPYPSVMVKIMMAVA